MDLIFFFFSFLPFFLLSSISPISHPPKSPNPFPSLASTSSKAKKRTNKNQNATKRKEKKKRWREGISGSEQGLGDQISSLRIYGIPTEPAESLYAYICMYSVRGWSLVPLIEVASGFDKKNAGEG